MIDEPQTDTTEPPLEQQYTWSRVVKELLYRQCWCEYDRDAASHKDGFGHCIKCGHYARPQSWNQPNYCTHALAWPALQKMLRATPTQVDRSTLMARLSDMCVPDEHYEQAATPHSVELGYLLMLESAQPWQIIKAIAETLEAEREALTPGVKGKEIQ